MVIKEKEIEFWTQREAELKKLHPGDLISLAGMEDFDGSLSLCRPKRLIKKILIQELKKFRQEMKEKNFYFQQEFKNVLDESKLEPSKSEPPSPKFNYEPSQALKEVAPREELTSAISQKLASKKKNFFTNQSVVGKNFVWELVEPGLYLQLPLSLKKIERQKRVKNWLEDRKIMEFERKNEAQAFNLSRQAKISAVRENK